MKPRIPNHQRLFKGRQILFLVFILQLLSTPAIWAHYTSNTDALASSQTVLEKVITGQVTSADSPEGLPGVNVSIEGAAQGTITDIDGYYSIEVPSDESVLVFSYIGFISQKITVGNRNVIDVTMAADVQALNEVVVVGYGYVKKSDLTGSVTQVDAEKIAEFPVYEVSQALKGRAAGVQVTQNSGRPGGRIEVRIRGNNSMIGSNEPLYVVDGYPITGDISFLNPADIASIDILKDASATAIYGSRGANGVVIVTTKKGGKNQPGRINVETYFGAQQVINQFELLDAQQYAIVVNEYLKNNGQTPFLIHCQPEQAPTGRMWFTAPHGYKITPSPLPKEVIKPPTPCREISLNNRVS